MRPTMRTHARVTRALRSLFRVCVCVFTATLCTHCVTHTCVHAIHTHTPYNTHRTSAATVERVRPEGGGGGRAGYIMNGFCAVSRRLAAFCAAAAAAAGGTTSPARFAPPGERAQAISSAHAQRQTQNYATATGTQRAQSENACGAHTHTHRIRYRVAGYCVC